MISINATFIITVLNFILLVFVLRFLLFKPLVSFLEDRAKKIEDSLKIADENKKREEELKIEHDVIIKEARNKASEIVDAAMSNVSKDTHKIMTEARAKAQATVDSAKEEILMEAERIKQDLRKDVAAMSISLAGKVLEREINQDDHKSLIDKSLDVMG